VVLNLTAGICNLKMNVQMLKKKYIWAFDRLYLLYKYNNFIRRVLPAPG
jgi:hypothetical protein